MGNYLPKADVDKKINYIYNKAESVLYVGTEIRGWRTTMEDAHICEMDIKDNGDDISIFGVFDGHGGIEVAKLCEEFFVKEFKKTQSYKDKKYKEALTETFKRMDKFMEEEEGLKKMADYRKDDQSDNKEKEETSAGCAAIVTVLTKTSIIVANAGDCRCMLCENDKVVEMSHDHKPNVPEEKARIEKAGGKVNDGRVNGNLNLTRAIGDLEYKKDPELNSDSQLIIPNPDILEYPRSNISFLVMGCDGIWENGNEYIVNFINTRIKDQKFYLSYEKILEELLDSLVAKETSTKMGLDNMTSILVAFGNLV